MAGFAAIVVAIRHRDISRWAREEQILLRMLLVASGMAVAFALLPALLRQAELAEPVVWRIGSASLMVWQAGIAVHRTRQFRAAGRPPPVSWLVYSLVTLILTLQALNIVLAAPWPYLLGIFGLLVNAFSFFWVLLLGRAGDRDAAA